MRGGGAGVVNSGAVDRTTIAAATSCLSACPTAAGKHSVARHDIEISDI